MRWEMERPSRTTVEATSSSRDDSPEELSGVDNWRRQRTWTNSTTGGSRVERSAGVQVEASALPVPWPLLSFSVGVEPVHDLHRSWNEKQ